MDLKFKPSVTKTHFQIPKIWIYKTNTDTALSKEMVGCDPKSTLQSFFYSALNGSCVMRNVKWIFPQNEIWQKLHLETTHGAVAHLLSTS